MGKIIGYARQSVDKKKIENSVKSQIKAIQTYTNKHHLQDVTFLSDVKVVVLLHVMAISLC